MVKRKRLRRKKERAGYGNREKKTNERETNNIREREKAREGKKGG